MTIDEWKNDFKGYVNALNIQRDDYNGIMEYIDELPFAQPEIIRCKDCKYYQFGRHFNDTRFCYRLLDDNGNHVGYNFSPNDFCSRAEREEE